MPRLKKDSSTSPAHYKQGGLEVITIWKKKLTHEEFKGLMKGNIEKYLFRADMKNGVEDYKKAAVYLQWLIEAVQEKEALAAKERADRRAAREAERLKVAKGVIE